MGTPTAAGFHSALNGADFRESQGFRESQNRRVMGIHVADTHSFIDLHRHDVLQGQTKVYLFPLSHYISWKLDTVCSLIDSNLINRVLMGKLYIVYC